MKKPQATRANPAQIEQHSRRQRQGLPGEFAQNHPIADAIIGGLILAAGVGFLVFLWIKEGAQV